MLISTKARNFPLGWPTPGRIQWLPKVSNRNEVVFCGCGSGKAIDMWWWWRENKSVVVVGVVAMEGQGQIYGRVQGVPKPSPPPP